MRMLVMRLVMPAGADGAADEVIQCFTHYSLKHGRERLGYDLLMLDAQASVLGQGGLELTCAKWLPCAGQSAAVLALDSG